LVGQLLHQLLINGIAAQRVRYQYTTSDTLFSFAFQEFHR